MVYAIVVIVILHPNVKHYFRVICFNWCFVVHEYSLDTQGSLLFSLKLL